MSKTILKAFSVRDAKTELFGQPFMAVTPADAQRSFAGLANNPQTTVAQFPEDFALWQIGEYDQSTGIMQSLQQPIHLCNAQDVIKRDGPRPLEQSAH